MSVADPCGLTGSLEFVERKFANCLEHDQAAATPSQEALVDERFDEIWLGSCDLLDRRQRRPTPEDGKLAEEASFVLGQELVAPGDRRVECALALG